MSCGCENEGEEKRVGVVGSNRNIYGVTGQGQRAGVMEASRQASAWHRPKRVARVYSDLIAWWVGLCSFRGHLLGLLSSALVSSTAGGDFLDFGAWGRTLRGLGGGGKRPWTGSSKAWDLQVVLQPLASPSQPSQQGKMENRGSSWPRRVAVFPPYGSLFWL